MSRPVKLAIRFGIVSGVSLGIFTLLATLVLGHVRPIWMEFSTAIPATIVGLAFGAITGGVWGHISDHD